MTDRHALFTPAEMAAADAMAASSGLDSFGLMERAGQAVAASALRLFPEALRFVVLCGPGNNGGDGYVAARALQRAGASVALFYLSDPARLKGDAARAAALCSLAGHPIEEYSPAAGDVVIDAVLGAGLSKDVPAMLRTTIELVTQAGIPVLAVDLPSGIDGLTGQVRGAAFKAHHTVTFMARKPGHVLLPGRMLCGNVEVFDIGIPSRIMSASAGTIWENTIPVSGLPRLSGASYKFTRGHLGVFSGGPAASGAARLSAMAGLRAGPGLVTIGAESAAVTVLANHLTAIMIHELGDRHAVAEWISDKRVTAFVLGPGFGAADRLRSYVELLAGRPIVLDADGITAFRDQPDLLFSLYAQSAEPSLVLTPHEGEFARLFPDIAASTQMGKVEKAARAAARAGAIVVYKGADTVIAGPDGACINTNAPPWLSTAGSGDVLAGVIGGLMAQGMPAFDAACAGVWIHGAAGQAAGPHLTAEDLPDAIAGVMAALA